MAKKKILLGVFDDEEILLKAVRNIRSSGIKIDDVMSPFPIHGLDPILGVKPTKLHTAGFIFGATGAILILLYITWINTVNYPMIIGGKPYFALPAWIPITFEVTVLSASVGMVIAYFIRNGLSAISQKPILDKRITDDKFVMVFNEYDLSKDQVDNIKDLLNANGASEVNEKVLD